MKRKIQKYALDDAGNRLPEPLEDPNRALVKKGMLSVIIPTYNEASVIERLLPQLLRFSSETAEIIFTDGGSTDGTLELIPESHSFRILRSPKKGRAEQMNYAAKASFGELLFFLHCDSELPEQAESELRKVLSRCEAGCFGIDFRDKRNLFMRTCKWISNHRVKDRKVMFGDQGIFLRRELFFRAGMFPVLPIMEDYQFSLTLKLMGVRLGMTKHRLYTSDRRFRGSTREKLSVMWKMNRLRAAYRRGVPPEELARQYRDIR